MIPKIPGRVGGNSGRKGGAMLALKIGNEQALYNHYLPFLKNGGLLVPTKKSYKLGDGVFLQLELFKERVAVSGKVAWINPEGAQGSRPQGIGVHFNKNIKNIETRDKIEKYLLNFHQLEKATYTM
jgi:type IV pilus assembly protein PilZ